MGKRGPKAAGYIRAVNKNEPNGRCELWFGKTYCGTYPTRADAEAARKDALRQMTPGGKLTAAYGQEWIASLETEADLRGAHDYWVKQQGMWNRHMNDTAWANMPPRAVKAEHAQTWVDELAKTRATQTKWVRLNNKKTLTSVQVERLLSASRIRDIVNMACMFFDRLISKGEITGVKAAGGKVIAGNPFRLVTLPTRIQRANKEARDDDDYDDDDAEWSEDYGEDDDEDAAMLRDQHIVHLVQAEIDQLFRQKLEPHVRCGWSIAVFCGLRKSEILSLKWRDFVLWGERPEVRVRRGYSSNPKRKKKLKSKRSRREVPLFPWVVKDILAYRDSLGRVPKLGEYVFLRSNTRLGVRHPYISYDRFAKSYDFGWRPRPAYKTARERAGIRPEVKFHALRHTCGSHLLQGTWAKPMPIQLVSRWLGHSSIAVTEQHCATLVTRNLHDFLASDRAEWDTAEVSAADLHAAVAA